ncbi:phosphatidylserine decarboxylase [Bacillus cereus]|uniref:Phosphatidylserine decarboxylase proenzyme n=1 Tax=Bacillus arachidis TaxID=2819290 RepID=A0ABS3NZU4_9BACI|nr:MULTISPECIES: phosphatidylserine decarboxylase [Bacillus]PGY04636.1 phosphatidylserine decarboxylase [Bacillus cereus]MBO1626458.1 phosphatidylserine decarboxylase [Bacillus arachidis]PFE05496.1 phosphatidylserine decarboxylase [Bacillus sp. AFS023182]WIY60359.1 phosphatidylserine decarboxylase [Bacillus arachidis]SDY52906.1 phosphatidylserine decarboxylase [Bacillus sp. 166amftsu]
MRRKLYRLMIELTNGRFTSYILRKFAQSRLSSIIISSYAKVFQLNQDEMEKDLKEYKTLHELFTRKLQEGKREIDAAPSSIVSPVDGVFADYGPIEETKTFDIKGKRYSIVDMLGNEERASRYAGGTYMVIYLSPSHYHRIHSPLTGTVTERFVLGRKSYPVNAAGMKYGKEPLSKNYRSVTEVDSAGQHMSLVKVGAMFVNSIELLHERNTVQKGEEMAYFTFGSTVVLLFEKGMVEVVSTLTSGQELLLGEKIATRLSNGNVQ